MNASNSKKRLGAKEFRELGYLQELNRQFLHPLGFALEVIIDDDGSVRFGEVWDNRDDPEGIYFGIADVGLERFNRMLKNAEYVESEKKRLAETRRRRLGFIIEPLE